MTERILIFYTQLGLQQAGECESQPADPEKAEDIPAVGDVKDSHPSGTLSNLAGGTPDCGTVTVAESGGRAPIVYSTRNLRASKPAKEDTRTQKRMRLTEVEKLKKDHDDTKKQRAVRGSKAQPEKSKEANIDSQQNAKGKRKRNMNAAVSEDVSAHRPCIFTGFFSESTNSVIQSQPIPVLCVCFFIGCTRNRGPGFKEG